MQSGRSGTGRSPRGAAGHRETRDRRSRPAAAASRATAPVERPRHGIRGPAAPAPFRSEPNSSAAPTFENPSLENPPPRIRALLSERLAWLGEEGGVFCEVTRWKVLTPRFTFGRRASFPEGPEERLDI
ncbi:hypothetical protein DV515_00011892 [Chloebia gouldiae]|uniref:Uncharacterized protein n=1 Tax=Chloebia gouldiae TaxID=44316 RepID=A0A3L8S5G8_CHLGU|nr:hypothetical protein DV515_00011892 [Chloebia gouldiae]